jgi:hypothetical protein
MYVSPRAYSQTPDKTEQVIEGGKIIVELVKAIGGKKDLGRDPGCKGNYADLCIQNQSSNSLTALLEHRVSGEKREVVVLPEGKECSLRARVGVWTYDLRVTGSVTSIRKGDLLIEGCNNMVMNIK